MPAPPGPTLDLGAVHLRLYALCVLGGLLVWMIVTSAIWRRGGGDRIEALWACIAAAPLALLGARLYSSATDALRGVSSPPLDFAHGGLGIYGAIAAGVFGLTVFCRARGWPVGTFLDCAVPGLALGQAIGRWGNYFNQELYGQPTSVPWGLTVDLAHRPVSSPDIATYQPTFLYESLWDVTICLLLVVAWRPIWQRFRPGSVAAIYLLLYAIGRFLVEGLRIDPAEMVGPFRFNQAASVFAVATSLMVLIALDRRRPPPGRHRRI